MTPPMPNQPQKNKINPAADRDIRAKINTAKSTLGLKGLNVAAALAGHKAFAAAAAKNPNASYSQVLNRVAPNARQQYATLGSAVPTEILNSGVPMSQFRATLQKLKQSRGALNNGYEITDKDQISESVNEALKDEQNPPAMMVLRRQAIRIFPDGRRVALYTNKQLGLTFTIPYTPNGTTPPATVVPGMQEEVEIVLENIDQLKKIADNKAAASVKFKNGSSMKVDHYTASAIHQVHNAVNDENKAKLARMISHSPEQFKKVADFALSKTTFKINK